MPNLTVLQWVGIVGGVNFAHFFSYDSIAEAMADQDRKGLGLWYLEAETSPEESNLRASTIIDALPDDERPTYWSVQTLGDQWVRIIFSGDAETLERVRKVLAL